MTLLQDIIVRKKEEVRLKKACCAMHRIQAALSLQTRDFAGALRGPGLAIIAEIKQRSPSAGILRHDFDPIALAEDYERFGACALSVLTDAQYFGGSNNHLTRVHAGTTLPILRKDFIVDEYQIYESRFIGADAILLIARILPYDTIGEFCNIARSIGMTCLVEVHTENELEAALKSGACVIGVNNRDLDTLDTDIATSIHLKSMIPGNYITVSESGVRTRNDMERIEAAGFSAVLIGQTLAAAQHVGMTMLSLQGRAREPAR